jgi:MFS family permease
MNVWRVAGVLCLIGIEALLYGYSYPFFSLALEKRELTNWLIGLNASLAGAGILFVGPLLPGLIARFGVHVLVAGLFAISFLSFAAILIADDLVVWFVARFVMGACFAALWTSTEIWLNGVVDDRHRGRIIGASGTLYATCQFLGPLLLGEVGVTGSLPLVVAMAPLAVGVVVALSIGPAAGETEEDEGLGDPKSLRLAVAVAGGLVAAAFLAGIGETAMQSLLPLYGLAHGFDDAGAARLVAVFSLGEAVLVAGLGWMADRYGRRLTLRLCVLVASLTTLAIPFAVDVVVLLWVVLFFAGGTVAGIYTLGIVLIGQDFRGQKLAVVSTGFAMAYSAGSVVGAAPVGYLIDLFGPEALPVAVAIGFVALSTYLFLGDSGERAGQEPRPAVPNLKYLEDTGFDEDETSVATETPVTAPGATPASDASAFRPAHSVPQSLREPRPRTELSLPEDDLEERFKRRSAEIAEIVSKRQKSREAQQSKPPSTPPSVPRQSPEEPISPFAPPPHAGNDG